MRGWLKWRLIDKLLIYFWEEKVEYDCDMDLSYIFWDIIIFTIDIINIFKYFKVDLYILSILFVGY